jgi:hypothetical protein
VAGTPLFTGHLQANHAAWLHRRGEPAGTVAGEAVAGRHLDRVPAAVPSAGVPDSTPVAPKLTPAGSAPVSEKVGVGKPPVPAAAIPDRMPDGLHCDARWKRPGLGLGRGGKRGSDEREAAVNTRASRGDLQPAALDSVNDGVAAGVDVQVVPDGLALVDAQPCPNLGPPLLQLPGC